MTDAEAAALTPDGEEISEIRFHSADNLHGLMPDRLARRLELAATSTKSGKCTYAERGSQHHPRPQETDQ
jgi:hypothetical protein